MVRDLKLRIIVEKPPAGVDFGVQKGHGSAYETVHTQRSTRSDMTFEFTVGIKGEGKSLTLTGPFLQGPPAARFVYLDIGTYAGRKGTPWSRRLKIPLTGIDSNLIAEANVLETRVPGTGRDGGPNCATVKPFSGWKAKQS